jgi:hypothetical protein
VVSLAGFEPATCEVVNALLYPLSYSETQAKDRFEAISYLKKYLSVWITLVIDFLPD